MSATDALRVAPAGIDTYQHPVAYMHRDCPVCRSEGFAALTRVSIVDDANGRELIATLNVVTGDWLKSDVVALSNAAWAAFAPQPGATVQVRHPEPARSASALRSKVFGQRLGADEFLHLMQDTVANRLSELELAAFVTACAGDRLDDAETVALTRAMIDVGERLEWRGGKILDKHCVGGLPGNRTTPIVVAVLAAAGHTIPKTSSRAITSPAGTADTMGVMAPVELDLDQMRRVVDREGGCIVWGGKVRLSPADDVLIRVERPLDFDSDGQLVASVLSKKIAAGSTHVLIDIPVGPTAKVRNTEAAVSLRRRLTATALAFGLDVRVVETDGMQPVGFGIGPALEARDVLAVLRGDAAAPPDLAQRACRLADELLSIAGDSKSSARALIGSGAAYRKFIAICEAQGGFSEPTRAEHRHSILAETAGNVAAVDNRRLARIAKLAGAPTSARAGVDCRIKLGAAVARGEPLYEIHAESPGELAYAVDYAKRQHDLFEVRP